MSVTATSQVVSYVGNNSTVTPYSYNVEFIDASTLVVYAVVTATGVLSATLTDGAGITVTQLANKKGSFVTTAAWANTYTLVAAQLISPTQLSEYDENARFPASTVEGDFDKTTLLIQMLLAYQARSFGFPLYAPTVGLITPVANSVFTFDSLGAALLRSQTDFISWLNLVPGSFTGLGQKIFANAADRAAATPDYVGQLALQNDTGAVYFGTALTAGSWTLYTTLPGAGTVTDAMLAASLDLSGKTLTLPAGVVGATTLSPNAVAAQTQKITLANGDRFLLWDSATSTLKYVLRSDLTTATISLPFNSGAYTTNTALGANIPLDDTIPTNTEGTQIISFTITPTVNTQVVRLSFNCMFGAGAGIVGIAALYRDGTCIKAESTNTSGTNTQGLNLLVVDAPATTSAVTYSVRVGASSGNMYLNGANTRLFGGAASAVLTAQCIEP